MELTASTASRFQHLPSDPREYIFNGSRFVMGTKPTKHLEIAEKANIPVTKNLVGGQIYRSGSQIMTNELSGHLGSNWTPEMRASLTVFMHSKGVFSQHIPY